MKAKRAESKGVKVADLAPWEVILAGGLGGLYYWMATFPVDSIKSALQVRHSGSDFCAYSVFLLIAIITAMITSQKQSTLASNVKVSRTRTRARIGRRD